MRSRIQKFFQVNLRFYVVRYEAIGVPLSRDLCGINCIIRITKGEYCELHVSKYFVSINTSVDYMIKDDDKNNRSTYPHLNNLDMRDIVQMCSGMSFPESFNFWILLFITSVSVRPLNWIDMLVTFVYHCLLFHLLFQLRKQKHFFSVNATTKNNKIGRKIILQFSGSIGTSKLIQPSLNISSNIFRHIVSSNL